MFFSPKDEAKEASTNRKLVGGWTNPFEKCESKWESSPNRGENKKYLKPPPRKIIRKYIITHLIYYSQLQLARVKQIGGIRPFDFLHMSPPSYPDKLEEDALGFCWWSQPKPIAKVKVNQIIPISPINMKKWVRPLKLTASSPLKNKPSLPQKEAGEYLATNNFQVQVADSFEGRFFGWMPKGNHKNPSKVPHKSQGKKMPIFCPRETLITQSCL